MKKIHPYTYIASIILVICLLGANSIIRHIKVQRTGDVIKATLVRTKPQSFGTKKGPTSYFQYGDVQFTENMGALYGYQPGDTFSFYHQEAYPEIFISVRKSLNFNYSELGACLFMLAISVYLLIYTHILLPRKEKAEYQAMVAKFKKKRKRIN